MMRRRTLTLHLVSLALTFSIGHTTAKVAQYVCSQRTIELIKETALVANDSNQNVQSAEETPANFFVDEDQLTRNDYTVERRIRKERTDAYEDPHNARNWVDVSYVVVKKGDRVLAKFDAGLAHPLGNVANLGFFPFLGGTAQQVFISEDVPRGGCQWIISLVPSFRVIFDGQALRVGREGYDLSAIDLDEDGTYEVIAPVTDFYELQDKLYIAAIPLPSIIFKYDPARQQYLPANSLFKDRDLEHLVEVPKVNKDSLNFEHRSAVLTNLLNYVYAGEEKRGWEFYEKNYKLKDKAEIKRRVKAILRDQPVYRFIYPRQAGSLETCMLNVRVEELE